MSEFANVDEALDALHEEVPRDDGSVDWWRQVDAARKNAERAREWLRAAVAYAQERGWPDKPMMTRTEVLKEVAFNTRAAIEENSINRGWLCAMWCVLDNENGYPERWGWMDAIHELALLMDAERSAQDGS